MSRGIGKTTAQIKAAPIGCIYIWCNDNTRYPRALASFLQRKDLKIVPASYLSDPAKFAGIGQRPILDHAGYELNMLTNQQHRNWLEIERYWDMRK